MPDFETRSVHSGGHKGASLSVPIVQSSTFRIPSVEHGRRLSLSDHPSEFYTRWGNPTVRALEEAVMELEGSEEALAFSSGMGAISASVMASVQPGGHIVASRCLYGGTVVLFSFLKRTQNITTTFVESTHVEDFQKAIQEKTQLLYVESPSNPKLDIFDLIQLGKIAKEQEVFSLVDGTLASPYNQRPIKMGFDAVVHSASKFYAGHSDVVAGVVAGSKSWMKEVGFHLKVLGACISPHDAWLTLRGIKTLSPRVRQQNETALKVAKFLEGHPLVASVFYPGLEGHPGHSWAKEYMNGFGGLLSFELKGGFEAGKRFLEGLQLFAHAVSLGGVESLAIHPASTIHARVSDKEMARAQITPGLVRLSIGLESYEDLKEDIKRALRESCKDLPKKAF